ncbi:uncharacterized protein [Macrobrachium rosenbergii]|uniref:uncharacterized protein n=1 Tax=Macrobrachium rosenbergii TaxID=79674 RepID=UPI0034D63C3D
MALVKPKLMTPTTVLLISLFMGGYGKHIVLDTGGSISEDHQNPVSTPPPQQRDFPANFSLYLLPLRYPLQNITELQIDPPYMNVDWDRFSRSRVVDFSEASRLPRPQEEFVSTFMAEPNGRTIFSLHPDDSQLQKPLTKLSQMPSSAGNILPSTAGELRPILKIGPTPFETDSPPQGADALLPAHPLGATFVLPRIPRVLPVIESVPDSTSGIPDLLKGSPSMTRPRNIIAEDSRPLTSHSKSSLFNHLGKTPEKTFSVPQNPSQSNELRSDTRSKLSFTIAKDFPPTVNETHMSRFITIQPDVRSQAGINSITPGELNLILYSYRDDRAMFNEIECRYACHERSSSGLECVVDDECCSNLFGYSDKYTDCVKMEILASALNDTSR